MLSFLRRRLDARRNSDEKGLAMLDVLLGTTIMILVTVIAIQNITMYRKRAIDSSLASDAQQVMTAIQAHYTQPNAQPLYGGSINGAWLNANGVNITEGNTFAINLYFIDSTGTGQDVNLICLQNGIGADARSVVAHDAAGDSVPWSTAPEPGDDLILVSHRVSAGDRPLALATTTTSEKMRLFDGPCL